MLICAKCIKTYKDKNGNDFALMLSDMGENFSVNLKYTNVFPTPDHKYVCNMKAAQYEGKAFLAFDINVQLT